MAGWLSLVGVVVGLFLCPLRVWRNGARRIGPIQTVDRDLELGGEDRRKLEHSRMGC